MTEHAELVARLRYTASINNRRFEESHPLVGELREAATAIETLEAKAAQMERERDEALAEIDRMTPKFVAYEYLESPARADIAEEALSAATDLMRKAHAVMRECGWQLAAGAEPSGDGILELACTEIETDFREFLEARNALKDTTP